MFLQTKNTENDSPTPWEYALTKKYPNLNIDISKFITFDQLAALIPLLAHGETSANRDISQFKLQEAPRFNESLPLTPYDHILSNITASIQTLSATVTDLSNDVTITKVINERELDLDKVPGFAEWPGISHINPATVC